MEIGKVELGVVLEESSLERAYRQIEEKFKNFTGVKIQIKPEIDCESISRQLSECLDRKIQALKGRKLNLDVGLNFDPRYNTSSNQYNRPNINQQFADNANREILSELRRIRRKTEAQQFERMQQPRMPNNLNLNQLTEQATQTLRTAKGLNPDQRYQITLNFKEGINSKGGFQQLITSVKEVNASVRRNHRKDKGFLGNAIVGFQEQAGVNFSKQIQAGVRDVFGKDAGQSARKFVRGGAKAFKSTFLDNTEFVNSAKEAEAIFGQRVRKAAFKLGDGIVAAIEHQGGFFEKLARGEQVATANVDAARTGVDILEEVERASKGVFKGIFSERAIKSITEPVAGGLKKHRDIGLEQRGVPLVRNYAFELAKSLSDEELGVSKGTKELILASGQTPIGTAFDDTEKGRKVVSLQTSEDDTENLVDSILKPNLKGYSRQGIEIAARALAAREKNPDINIKILGEGLSGFAAEEANELLKKIGVSADFIGVNTPEFIGGLAGQGKKIVSSDVEQGQEVQKLARLGIANLTPQQQLLGARANNLAGYGRIAELQNFINGSPGQLSEGRLDELLLKLTKLRKLNPQKVKPEAQANVANEIFGNLQEIRRYAIDATGETAQQLERLATEFEKEYVRYTPDGEDFGKVRAFVEKSKKRLGALAKEPGLAAAVIAQRSEKELASVQKEFQHKFKEDTTGTGKKKYEALNAQIDALRELFKNPALGLSVKSPEPEPEIQQEVVQTSKDIAQEVEKVQEVTEEILKEKLEHIRSIVDNFQKVYKEQFKEAKSPQDIERIGTDLLKYEAGISGLVKQTKSDVGATGTSGTVNNQLNQMLGRVSRTRKTVERKFKVNNIPLPEGLAEGIQKEKELAKEAAKEVSQEVIDESKKTFEIESPSKVFQKMGEELMMGLSIGTQKEKEPVEAVRETAEEVIQEAKNTFEIQSPSKVFQRIGNFISEGLNKGIGDGLKETQYLFGATVNEIQSFFSKAAGEVKLFFELANQPQGAQVFQNQNQGLFGSGKSILQLTAMAAALGKVIPMLSQFSMEALEVAANMEVLERRLEFVSGSRSEGRTQIGLLTEQATSIGINPGTSLENAAGLLASSKSNPIALQEATQGQMALNQAAKVYGLTIEEQTRASTALQQSLDKQIVQQEELRGQLAEALPGSLGIASRAYGTTTQKLNQMVRGGLDASEFFRKFTEQLDIETAGGLAGALGTVQGKQGLADAKFANIQKDVGDLLLPLKGFSLDALNAGLDLLKASLPVVTALITAFATKMTLLATVTLVDTVKKLALTNVSMVKFAATLKAVKVSLISSAKEFAVLFALGASVKYAIDRFSDLSGELRQQVDAVKDLRREYVELTKIQDKASKNDFQIAGDRLIVGFKDFFTGEVKAVKDSIKAINDSMKQTGEIVDTATSSGVATALDNLARIDKALQNVQTRKRALAANNPGDKEGLRKLNEEEKSLLKQRADSTKVPTNVRKQIAAQQDAIKTQLDYLQKLKREYPLYAEEVAGVDRGIAKLTKHQEELNKLQTDIASKLGKSATAFDLLQRSIKGVADSFADLNQKGDLFFNNERIKLGLSSLSPEQQQIQSQVIDNQENDFRLQQARKQYSETRSLLDTDENRAIMQSFGVDFDTGANRLNTLLEQTENIKDKFVFETLAQLKQQQLDISELAAASVSARKELENQFRDIARQVEDYYQSLARSAQETSVEVQRLTNETKNQKLQNELKKVLADGYDTVVGSIIDGISSALDSFNNATESVIENQQNQIANSFELLDANKANLEIQRQIPAVDIRLDFSSIPADNNVATLNEQVNQAIGGTENLGFSMQGVNQSSEDLFGTLNSLINPLMSSQDELKSAVNLTESWNSKTSQIPGSLDKVTEKTGGLVNIFTDITTKTAQWLGQLSNAPGLLGQIVQGIGGFFNSPNTGGITANGGFVSPIKGVSIQQLLDYKPTRGQGFYGRRSGGRQHRKIDFDSRVNAGQGAEILAAISGKAKARMITPISGGVDIEGTDSKGNKITVVYNHLAIGELTKLFRSRGGVGAKGGFKPIDVKAGERLSTVTMDSLSTGAHLDFGIKVNGKYVKPQEWMRTEGKAMAAMKSQISGGLASGNGSGGITRGGNLLSAAEQSKLTALGRELYQYQQNPNVLAFGDVIARAEGTDFRKNSKNFGYSMLIGGSHDNNFNRHPFAGNAGDGQRILAPKHNSTASGRFQMMDFNYSRALAERQFGKGARSDLSMVFQGDNPGSFSPAVQDLYFTASLKQRGVLDEVLRGDFEAALRNPNLAKHYASLQSGSRRSAYGGQGTPQGQLRSTVPFAQQRLQARLNDVPGTAQLQAKASAGLSLTQNAIQQRATAQRESTEVKRQSNLIAGETALARVRQQTEKALRDMKKQSVTDERALTDLKFDSIPFPTKQQQNLKESTANLRQYQDTITELKQRLEDSSLIVKQADKAIEVFNQQLSGGDLDANQQKAIEEGITQNTKLREQALQDKARIEKIIADTETAFKSKEAARVEKANFEEYLRASKAAIDSQTQENNVLQEKINHLEKIKEFDPGTLGSDHLPKLKEELALRQLEVDTASKLLQIEEEIKRSGDDSNIVSEKDKLLKQLEKENHLKLKQIELTRKLEEQELKLAASRRALAIESKFVEINSQLQQEKLRSLERANKQNSLSLDTGELSRARYENFNNEQTTLGIDLQKDIADIRQFGKENGLSADRVNALVDSLKELNQVKLSNLKQEFEETLKTDQLDDLRKVRETLEAQFQLKTQSGIDLRNAQADRLEGRGDVLGAKKIRLETQRQEELFKRQQSLKELDERVIEARLRGIEVTDREIASLKDNIVQLSEINLANLNDQFNPWLEVSKAGIDGMKTSIKGLIDGTMSLGDAFTNIGASIADTLANLAAEWITNELVSGIFGIGKSSTPSFGGFGGSSGGGDLFGSIFNIAGGLFGFSSGGEVPVVTGFNSLRGQNNILGEALRKEGSNSVLATLTPGERVLTVNEAKLYRDMFPNGIMQYSRGGDVVASMSSNTKAAVANGSNINVNMPVNYQEGSNLKKSEQLGGFLRAAVIAEIQRQSEPGGLLNK